MEDPRVPREQINFQSVTTSGVRTMHERRTSVSSRCLICWESVLSATDCEHCGQSACDECLRSFLSTRILQGNVSDRHLACPNFECGVLFSQEKLEKILKEEMYAKLVRLRHISAVNRDPQRCWCPNRECGQVVDLRKSHRLKLMGKRGATCGSCGAVFCPQCGSLPHWGTCPRDASYTKWISMIERTHEKGVQPCPRCHHHIEKRGGCQHMYCSMCSAEWCWICRRQWSGHQMTLCKVVRVYRHKAWGNGPLVRTVTMTAALPFAMCMGAGILTAGTVVGMGWVVGMTGYVVVILPGKSAKASAHRAWQRRKEAIEKRRAVAVDGDVPEDEPELPVIII